MSEVARVGDSIIMTPAFLSSFIEVVTEKAITVAAREFRILQMKDQTLTVSEVAKLEKCSKPTVLLWINEGLNGGTLKLNASRLSTRTYSINRYDLEEFKSHRNNL